MIDGTKCEKCLVNDAEVYLAIVDGFGKISRKKYCKNCAMKERIKAIPNFVHKTDKNFQDQDRVDRVEQDKDDSPSPLNLVQNIMDKAYSNGLKNKPNNKILKIKNLEIGLARAIKIENYEMAASIRDQIEAIKNPSKGLPYDS